MKSRDLKYFWSDEEEFSSVQSLHAVLKDAYLKAFGTLDGLYPVYKGWTMDPTFGVPYRKAETYKVFDPYVADLLMGLGPVGFRSGRRHKNARGFLDEYLGDGLIDSEVDRKILRRSYFHRALSFSEPVFSAGIAATERRLRENRELSWRYLEAVLDSQNRPHTTVEQVRKHERLLDEMTTIDSQWHVLQTQLDWLHLWKKGYEKWLSDVKRERTVNVQPEHYRRLIKPEYVSQRLDEFEEYWRHHPEARAQFLKDNPQSEEPEMDILGRWYMVMLWLCGATSKERHQLRTSSRASKTSRPAKIRAYREIVRDMTRYSIRRSLT